MNETQTIAEMAAQQVAAAALTESENSVVQDVAKAVPVQVDGEELEPLEPITPQPLAPVPQRRKPRPTPVSPAAQFAAEVKTLERRGAVELQQPGELIEALDARGATSKLYRVCPGQMSLVIKAKNGAGQMLVSETDVLEVVNGNLLKRIKASLAPLL